MSSKGRMISCDYFAFCKFDAISTEISPIKYFSWMERLTKELYEYICRLAALVGTQNFSVDDNRSDLTDPFKPTKLAEDYRAIYDNEWETAYEELEVVLDEPKILIYLGKVTWVKYI